MEYARFVRLRSPLWDDFESRLEAARKAPTTLSHEALETLALKYRQILHDHAQASDRYPETGAARRLRRLAISSTHWLHWDSTHRVTGPLHFFRDTFPNAFRRQLPFLGVALALFATAMIFGASLALERPGLGLAILGPSAVRGLKEGRLWTDSLVSAVPPAVSSSSIATNNMTVALTGWAGGALAGIGSVYVIVLNGFVFGAILATTLHYSLASQILEFVSAHGPLEITLILTTAAAGLALGHALVAAEDRPRREVAGEAGFRALVVLGGCLPWFLVLGIVEGFLSPSPALTPSLKVSLGGALEALFLLLAWNPFLREA